MDWISLIGLLFGILGPALVILPTLPQVERFLIDQRQIDLLQGGRKELHSERMIARDHPSYSVIYDVIEQNSSEDLIEECCGFRVPQIGFTSEDGDRVFTQGTIVYAVDSQGTNSSNPLTENISQEIESVFVVDDWISDRMRRLRESRIQRIRGFGFLLIVLSVFSQTGFTSL